MSKVTMSKVTFENLVKHLVEVEEGKDLILQQYFPAPTKERNEFKVFIENYIKQIDQLIRNANKSQTGGNKIPFVIIDSEVEVEDLADQEVYRFQIASPFHGGVKGNDTSYLSPIGKSLILKKVNDTVEVKAPNRVLLYKVKSIKYWVK